MKSDEEYRKSIDQKVSVVTHKRKLRNRFITFSVSAAVCFVLMIGVAAVISDQINRAPLPEYSGGPGISAVGGNEGTGHRQSFGGFVLTAYAAEENGVTVDFTSEDTAVILQPNVDVLLGKYTPLMSSVPGLPFKFCAADHCGMEVSVDKGTLCRWDSENGSVTQCGQTTSCAEEEILYWSPLTEDGETVENAVITVIAKDEGRIVGEQKMYISSKDFIYSVCMDEVKLFE